MYNLTCLISCTFLFLVTVASRFCNYWSNWEGVRWSLAKDCKCSQCNRLRALISLFISFGTYTVVSPDCFCRDNLSCVYESLTEFCLWALHAVMNCMKFAQERWYNFVVDFKFYGNPSSKFLALLKICISDLFLFQKYLWGILVRWN